MPHINHLSMERIPKAQIAIFLFILALLPVSAFAQEEREEDIEGLPTKIRLKSQWYRRKDLIIEHGDTLLEYFLPEITVYAPLVFKSRRQEMAYNRLVYNVKRVLPLAQEVNRLLCETYELLEQLPDEKTKSAHISAVEEEIKEHYTPIMKKLTYSQGKLLIKLIDRECNQSSFEIVKAFLGPAKATFYQVFAWTFRASLKKTYDPEGDDRLIERVVRQVETGQL